MNCSDSGLILTKTIEQVALLLAAGPSEKVVLHFNQGGLINRNAPEAAKAFVRDQLVQAYAKHGRKKADITGYITCNLHVGKVQSLSWHLKRIPLAPEFYPGLRFRATKDGTLIITGRSRAPSRSVV